MQNKILPVMFSVDLIFTGKTVFCVSRIGRNGCHNDIPNSSFVFCVVWQLKCGASSISKIISVIEHRYGGWVVSILASKVGSSDFDSRSGSGVARHRLSRGSSGQCRDGILKYATIGTFHSLRSNSQFPPCEAIRHVQ